MVNIDEQKEYWYDIYALSENRDISTIETFLSHFADRRKVEYLKFQVFDLVPDVPITAKHKLFEKRYSPKYMWWDEDPFSLREEEEEPLPEPEILSAENLSAALDQGVSRRNQAFSIYFRNYVRKDLKCLLVHFTLDNKVVLGLSLGETDKTGRDNLPYAQKIKQEIEKVVQVKSFAIGYDSPPPESEEEFLEFKKFFETISEDKKEFVRSEPGFWYAPVPWGYYHQHRKWLHRRVRRFVFEPNLSAYYTVGDDQGRIANVIKYRGQHKAPWPVENPDAKDLVRLDLLGDLLNRTIPWGSNGFQPAKIHRVSDPDIEEAEIIWIGHRDRASDITFYEGIRTSTVTIEDTFCLGDLEDVKRLAEEGFFNFKEGFVICSNIEAYEKWLIKYEQDQLYLDLLLEKEPFLLVNAKTLLLTVGARDWKKFLLYLHQFNLGEKDKKELLQEMCGYSSFQWQAGQLEDMLRMVSLTDSEYERLLESAANSYRYDLFEFLFLQKKPSLSLTHLIQVLKYAFAYPHQAQADKFVSFYLQEIGRQHGTFCDYPFIMTLAASEERRAKDLLVEVLKLLPPPNWHSAELLNIALATENEYILGKLNYSPSEIERFRQSETEAFKQRETEAMPFTPEKKEDLLIRAVNEGNYFQVEYLTPQIHPPYYFITSMLEACRLGLIGIVKVLVEKGNADPDGWDAQFRYPIGYAKLGGFTKLRQYLISKGVEDKEAKKDKYSP